MKLIKEFLDKIFSKFNMKNDERKLLPESTIQVKTNSSKDFSSELKSLVTGYTPQNTIKILVCEGDGMGIQTKFSY